jgi:hypothetical protein
MVVGVLLLLLHVLVCDLNNCTRSCCRCCCFYYSVRLTCLIQHDSC